MKDSTLYVLPLEDGVLSAKFPLCNFYGKWLTAEDDKHQIAKHKATGSPWYFDEDGAKWCFTATAGGEPKLGTVREAFDFLEGEDHTDVKLECHKVERQAKNNEDGSQVTWSIKNTEECLFVAMKPKKNMQASQLETFASFMELKYFDLPKGTHKDGHVCVVQKAEYSVEDNCIIPGKPALLLVNPLKVQKDKIIKLG